MRIELRLIALSTTVLFASCSQPSNEEVDIQPAKTGTIVFTGGHNTDPQDHGRPVVLIAAALDVKPEVFRKAFSKVTPAENGKPSESEARANKRVLLDALVKHGVTNERLDEVSDYYRYRPGSGELWQHTPASATAVIEDGGITSIKIENAGAGYSSTPVAKIAGFGDIRLKVTVEYSTDLKTNGRVVSIEVAD